MKKEIAFGTLILIASNLLSRILGLARDSLLAHRGGLSLEVDAYNLAFLIPDLLNHFLGAGLLPVTLIPLITHWLKNGDYDSASHYISRLINAVGVVVIVGCVLAFWQMPNLLPLICEKALSPELFDKTVYYSRILIFAQVFFVASGFFNAMQYGRMRFLLPALAPLAYNGMIILGGLFWTGATVEGFCWGVLTGAFIGSFLFQWLGAKQAGFKWSMIWDPFSPELSKYVWRTLPFLVGASAVFANEFVYRRFGMDGEGSIASLGFGLRISMAISGVLGGAVGVAVYPWFSQLCSDQKHTQLSFELGKLWEKLLVVILPILILVYASAEILIRFYLGSGHFGATEVARQVPYLQAYLWQVIPMTLLFLVNRAFYADQRTWFPSIISVGFFLLSWPFYSYFADYGAIRVPWISTLTTFFTFMTLALYWLWKFPGLKLLPLLKTLGLCLGIAGGQYLIYAHWLSPWILSYPKGLYSLGLYIGSFGLLAVIQWLLLALLGVETAREFLKQLKRKFLRA